MQIKDNAYYLRLEATLKAARRQEQADLAGRYMMPFMRMTNPDPDDFENVDKSAFTATPLARLLCQVIEQIDAGKLKRVCVSVGPQFGKSQVLSRGAPAWLSGRNPRRNMILGSYNDTFAQEFGGDVREIMQGQTFHQVFPEHQMRKGSEAKDLLITKKGGKMAFVGVGGSGTGKPADIFFVDDPIKSDEDAQSAVYRQKLWKWFTTTANSRCHNDSAIIVVHTRWHEDDLIGRLCDPDHPERNKLYKGIADRWTYYNLPAIVQDETLAASLGLTLEPPKSALAVQQFGTKPMASLWEERKSIDFLAESKMLDDRGFGALYMGAPSPEQGSYFTMEDIVEYHSPEDLPKKLNWYGASDHAVSEEQKADSSVVGCAGVDSDSDIWIPPDVVWDKMETDQTVEEIINQMVAHNALVWWLESELISKSFGPFLKIRMHERKVYTTVDPKVPSKKKPVRARAIQGRMRMRKVHFPAFAPWWPDAKKQLLKFPYGTHDDFVDWLSWIGLGLAQEYPAEGPKKEEAKTPEVGTIAWIKMASGAREKQKRIQMVARGW